MFSVRRRIFFFSLVLAFLPAVHNTVKGATDFAVSIQATPQVRGPWTNVTIFWTAGFGFPYNVCEGDQLEFLEINGTDGWWHTEYNVQFVGGNAGGTLDDTVAFWQGPTSIYYDAWAQANSCEFGWQSDTDTATVEPEAPYAAYLQLFEDYYKVPSDCPTGDPYCDRAYTRKRRFFILSQWQFVYQAPTLVEEAIGPIWCNCQCSPFGVVGDVFSDGVAQDTIQACCATNNDYAPCCSGGEPCDDLYLQDLYLNGSWAQENLLRQRCTYVEISQVF
jgi:hypothetical protein